MDDDWTDAQRYRWLRNHPQVLGFLGISSLCNWASPQQIDRSVDQMIQGEKDCNEAALRRAAVGKSET